MGMLFLDETRMMSSNAEGIAQFENLIRRDRNHPCVFMWNMGNEERESTTETGLHILSTMKRSATKLDGSRPVTVAPPPLGLSLGQGGLNVSDVVSYRRFGKLFEFQAAYLFSSSIINTFFTGGISTGTPSVWNVNQGESGPSDYFQRHRFVASGTVHLPLAFRLTGVTVAASGLLVNPLSGVDNDGDGILADRAFGQSRNSFREPDQAQTDLAIARTFHLEGRLHVETRTEISNVLNHDNYVKLTTTYGNGVLPGSAFRIPTAGISNSDPARQFQFGAKVLF